MTGKSHKQKQTKSTVRDLNVRKNPKAGGKVNISKDTTTQTSSSSTSTASTPIMY